MDLWIELSSQINGREVEWIWVKGHSDCRNNNNADAIAKSAIVTSYMEK
jgi:ribonuclease HI